MLPHDCPMTHDRKHIPRGWRDNQRSGLSCYKCHKTWEYHGDELRPTYRDTPDAD